MFLIYSKICFTTRPMSKTKSKHFTFNNYICIEYRNRHNNVNQNMSYYKCERSTFGLWAARMLALAALP